MKEDDNANYANMYVTVTFVPDKKAMKAAERCANTKTLVVNGVLNTVLELDIKLNTVPFTKFYTQCLRKKVVPKIMCVLCSLKN